MTQPLLTKQEVDQQFAPVFQVIHDQLGDSDAVKAQLQARVIDVVTNATSSQIATSEQANGKFPELQCITKIRHQVHKFFSDENLEAFGAVVQDALVTLHGRALQIDPNAQQVGAAASNHDMIGAAAQLEDMRLENDSPDLVDLLPHRFSPSSFDFNVGVMGPVIPTDEEIQANPIAAARQMADDLIRAAYDGEEDVTAESPIVRALDAALNAIDAKYPGTRGDINALLWQNLSDEERAVALEKHDPDYCGNNYYKHPRALTDTLYEIVKKAVTDLFGAVYGETASDASFFIGKVLPDNPYNCPARTLSRLRPDALEDVAVEVNHKPRVEAFLQRLPVEMRNEVFGQLYANLLSKDKQKAAGHPTYCSDNYMDHLEELHDAVSTVVPHEIIRREKVRVFEEIAELCNTVIALNPLAAENERLFDVLRNAIMEVVQGQESYAVQRVYEPRIWEAETFSVLPTLAEIHEAKAVLANLQTRIEDAANYQLSDETKNLFHAIHKLVNGWSYFETPAPTEAELEVFIAFIGVDRFNALKVSFYQEAEERLLQDAESDFPEAAHEAQLILDAMKADPDWAGNNLLNYEFHFTYLARQKVDETLQEIQQKVSETTEASVKGQLSINFIEAYETRDLITDKFAEANPDLHVERFGLVRDFIDTVVYPRLLAE